MKTCSRCHSNPPRSPRQRYCKHCHAELQRLDRATRKDQRDTLAKDLAAILKRLRNLRLD
jgi:hypothetical protein